MTNEEKQLLLKDLCARLPYGVICKLSDNAVSIAGKLESGGLDHFIVGSMDVTPYLRPMSSMTKEERKEWQARTLMHPRTVFADKLDCLIDWLNEHHFDYRGLIPMGLALEAPEDMYKEN